jgi:hypothetical protein
MAEFFGIPIDSVSESRIFVEERLYLIILQLFDKDGNRITMTENIELVNNGLLDQDSIERI